MSEVFVIMCWVDGVADCCGVVSDSFFLEEESAKETLTKIVHDLLERGFTAHRISDAVIVRNSEISILYRIKTLSNSGK